LGSSQRSNFERDANGKADRVRQTSLVVTLRPSARTQLEASQLLCPKRF
jgi:hypothetical protein